MKRELYLDPRAFVNRAPQRQPVALRFYGSHPRVPNRRQVSAKIGALSQPRSKRVKPSDDELLEMALHAYLTERKEPLSFVHIREAEISTLDI